MMYERNGANPQAFDVRLIHKYWPRLLKIMGDPRPATVMQARRILKEKIGMKTPGQINRMLIGAYLANYHFVLNEFAAVRDPGKWGAELETSFSQGGADILLKVLTRQNLPSAFFKGSTPPRVSIAGVQRGLYGFLDVSEDDFHRYLFNRKGLTVFFQVNMHLTGGTGVKRVSDGVIMMTEYGDTAHPDANMNKYFPGMAAMWAPIGVKVRDLLDALEPI